MTLSCDCRLFPLGAVEAAKVRTFLCRELVGVMGDWDHHGTNIPT